MRHMWRISYPSIVRLTPAVHICIYPVINSIIIYQCNIVLQCCIFGVYHILRNDYINIRNKLLHYRAILEGVHSRCKHAQNTITILAIYVEWGIELWFDNCCDEERCAYTSDESLYTLSEDTFATTSGLKPCSPKAKQECNILHRTKTVKL